MNYEVGTANTHDNKFIERLVDENDKGQCLYADGGYDCEGIEEMLKSKGIISTIRDVPRRNKVLTSKQER